MEMFDSKQEMKEGIMNNSSANIPKRRKVDFKINNLTTRQKAPTDCKNSNNSEINHKESISQHDISLIFQCNRSKNLYFLLLKVKFNLALN